MEMYAPPHSPMTLNIDTFSFAYIFRLQILIFLLEHNTVTQAESHRGAALQQAPLPHQNKASQCLKSNGGSQRKGLAALKRFLRSPRTSCSYRRYSDGSSSHSYDFKKYKMQLLLHYMTVILMLKPFLRSVCKSFYSSHPWPSTD